MIRFDMTPLPGTQTPERGIRWQARCGDHVCEHHLNAVTGLARLLVQSGVPEASVSVFYDGKQGLCYPSLKWLADHVLLETPGEELQWHKYREFRDFGDAYPAKGT